MNFMDYVVIAVLFLHILTTTAAIGKRRAPINANLAVGTTVINAAFIVTFILWHIKS